MTVRESLTTRPMTGLGFWSNHRCFVYIPVSDMARMPAGRRWRRTDVCHLPHSFSIWQSPELVRSGDIIFTYFILPVVSGTEVLNQLRPSEVVVFVSFSFFVMVFVRRFWCVSFPDAQCFFSSRSAYFSRSDCNKCLTAVVLLTRSFCHVKRKKK